SMRRARKAVAAGMAVWSLAATAACAQGEGAGGREARPAPVAVAPVEKGPIALRRTYSGTLESPAQFVVAPKVGGRVERLFVDLGDAVERGRVVAELDDAEFVHLVREAKAELAVARANQAEAKSALEIA